MGGKETILKEMEGRLVNSFSRLKNDILSLKKSRNNLSKEVSELNTRFNTLEKNVPSKEEVHSLKLKVEKILYEQKSVKDMYDTLSDLRQRSVMKSEFDKKYKSLESDVKELKKEIKKLNKTRDAIKESRIKAVENNQLKLSEVKDAVMKEIKGNYPNNDELVSQLKPIRKEMVDLYNKVSKVKRDVLNFQKTRFASNIILTISLISFVGAAVSLNFRYLFAANFLGVEGIVFLVAGLLVKLYVLLRK